MRDRHCRQDSHCKNSPLRGILATIAGASLALLLIAADPSANVPPASLPAKPEVTASAAKLSSTTRRLRPHSLALLQEDTCLLVGNRDSGSLIWIDTRTRKALVEHTVGPQLADFAVSGNGELIATAHQNEDRVRFWRSQDKDGLPQLTQLGEIEVPQAPVAVRLNSEGTLAFVSSLWDKALSIIQLDGGASDGDAANAHKVSHTIRHRIPLSFSPRRLVLLQGERELLVADAFGGQFSLIDIENGTIQRTLRIPGVNILGLTLSPRSGDVVVAHQILNQLAETSRDGVFWGIVMTNNLRVLPLENIRQMERQPLEDAYVHFLGDPRAGAGDPTAVCVTSDGTFLTTLGGVDEVAIGRHLDHSFDRAAVGRRPAAIVATADGRIAYVANMFSDSISVIDVPRRKVIEEIPLQADAAPLTSVERGESLFYDARLSLDGWYSCHSCHTDGHTVGLLSDNLGDDNYGAPKRIPSLLGTAGTGPWQWNGSQKRLEEQVHKSVVTTMQGEDPGEEQVADLAAFVARLPAPPRPRIIDEERVARGREVFSSHGCNNCHVPPLYTSQGVYDVGLKDQHGRSEFNPPSLRGVRLRGPYFHDNRAATLEAVFRSYKHQLNADLTDEDLAALITFLESL